MNRALPGPMIDLIRDGVPGQELRQRGDVAVWSALLGTAASARQRCWDREEWEAELSHTVSTLGRQARLKKGRRERSAKAYAQLLYDAWDKATVWVSEQPPPFTRAEMAEEAEQRVRRVLLLVQDLDSDLTEAERAVLAYAANEALARGLTRVALPRRSIVSRTGLGERTIRTALERLERKRLLTLAVPGRPGATQQARRAALYLLPTEEALAQYLYRGTRSMGPPAQNYGTPVDPRCGTPTSSMGRTVPRRRGRPFQSTHPRAAAAHTCDGAHVQRLKR